MSSLSHPASPQAAPLSASEQTSGACIISGATTFLGCDENVTARHSAVNSSQNAREPLTEPCPHCDNGWLTSINPSVRAIRCDVCDGENEIVMDCSGCRAVATEIVAGHPFCAEHAEGEREWVAVHGRSSVRVGEFV